MSHEDLTEETKALLKSMETNDAKVSTNEKSKESHEDSGVKETEDDDKYETNTEEDPDSEW